jgi:hypothetical protein
MSRRKARRLALLALASALSSCALVSLERLVVTTTPAEDGQIVSPEGPIRVSFSIEPEPTTAEKAIKVSSAAGTSSGDFRWSGKELSFFPIPPLKKGYLWTLSIEGKIKALDGRSFDVDEALSFYAGSSATLLTLDSSKPAAGATVSTAERIVLEFSRAVDQSAFKRSFSLSPSTAYDVAWSDDGRTATIAPKTRWSALTTYAWQLRADLVDSDGVGLARAYEGGFVVQSDDAAPTLSSARPALYSNGTLSPLESDLGQLGYLDAVYLSFSEEVTLESVADAINFTPMVKGRVLRDGKANFAFLPEEGFAARTRYRLCVLSSVADLAGNTMPEDFVAWFTPRVADIAVDEASITNRVGAPTLVSGFGDAYSYGFEPTIDACATVSLKFNVPIADAAQRDRIVTLINCSSLFPSATSPALKSAQWASDSRLDLSYAGFAKSAAAKTYYYKFLIPGGSSGISDGDGGTMEKDLWLVLYTE